MSIDPDVATTNQPYVFTNDDPLNAEDSLGLAELYDAPEGLAGGINNFGVTAATGGEGDVTKGGEDGVGEAESESTIRSALSKLARSLKFPEVDSEGELNKLFKQFTKGAVKVGEEETSKGVRIVYKLPDGTRVQYRSFSSDGSGNSPTLDITFPDKQIVKVHIAK
jgi:hypothetical protein